MHSKQWSKTCKRLYCIFICIKNYCQCRLYSLTWFLRVILDYDFTIEEIMFIRQNKKLSTVYPICLSLKSMRRIGRREKSVCVGRGEGRQRDTYCMLKVWDGRKEEERENTSSVETVVLRHSVPPKHSTTYATSYKTFCQINIYKRKREKKVWSKMSNFSSKLAVDPYDWSYAEYPDIPESVYTIATVYMVIIGSFGIISNTAILVAFFRGPSQVIFFYFLQLKLCSLKPVSVKTEVHFNQVKTVNCTVGAT